MPKTDQPDMTASGAYSVIHFDRSKVQDPSRALKDLLPTARKIEGFMGAMEITHPETGNKMAVMLWEDEQAQKRADQTADYRNRLAQVGRSEKFVVEGRII